MMLLALHWEILKIMAWLCQSHFTAALLFQLIHYEVVIVVELFMNIDTPEEMFLTYITEQHINAKFTYSLDLNTSIIIQ